MLAHSLENFFNRLPCWVSSGVCAALPNNSRTDPPFNALSTNNMVVVSLGPGCGKLFNRDVAACGYALCSNCTTSSNVSHSCMSGAAEERLGGKRGAVTGAWVRGSVLTVNSRVLPTGIGRVLSNWNCPMAVCTKIGFPVSAFTTVPVTALLNIDGVSSGALLLRSNCAGAGEGASAWSGAGVLGVLLDGEL